MRSASKDQLPQQQQAQSSPMQQSTSGPPVLEQHSITTGTIDPECEPKGSKKDRESEELRKERAQRRDEQERRRQQQAEAEEARRRQAEETQEAEADRVAWEHEKEWLTRTDVAIPWHQKLIRSLVFRDPEPETPNRRFLFSCNLGDPISCVMLGPGGACMAGSVQGRVWMLAGPTDNTRRVMPGAMAPPPRSEVLAGFSDEGVRGLYLDEDHVYATFVDSCRGWRRSKPHAPTGALCFKGLDKKNTAAVKHVLQRGDKACVLFPLSSTIVNVARRGDHQHRAFKLFDFGTTTEVAPCDFDGTNLVLIDRTRLGGMPAFHLVHLEDNEQVELDEIPEACWISIVRLWGPKCVACTVGRTLYLYDYRLKQVRHVLRGHWAEILAVDARDPETLATLSADGIVKIWSGTSGACTRTLRVPGANFYLAYPYCICVQDQRILISCDEGVYLVELGPTSDEV